MSDPLQLPHQDRPDPAVLLIDAVINRQSELAQRLSQQIVHRQGVSALERVVQANVLTSCGEEGAFWLSQQLGEVQQQPPAPPAAASMGSLIKEALHEAVAPWRNEAPAADAANPELNQAPDPWELNQPLVAAASTPASTPASGQPAPRPADLAEWRSWLCSDAA
ncbi:MAG: hypothetical protein FJ078_07510 [Cyanobacteria bacterium K_DeepCast_35m_m2_155]|nr:hypothetical protein [Cyanobacteria bacterium K_DeepCast_35m_m2_155]